MERLTEERYVPSVFAATSSTAASSTHKIVTITISAAVPTNMTTARFGAATSGPFMTLSALEPLRVCSGHSVRLSTFYTEAPIVIIFRRLI